MSAKTGPVEAAQSPSQSHGRSKSLGLRSVYAKTMRDSRLAIVILAVFLGLMLLATGADYGRAYATPNLRTDFVNLIHGLPAAIRGIYGTSRPAHLTTLGGMMSFKVAASLALTAYFWSILALSGTLAGEARAGSLELVMVTPEGRRRLAIQKLAAHITSLGVVLVVLASVSVLVGLMFGTLPGDRISVQAAIGFAIWVMVMALASGSLAFALSCLLGRASAAGVAGSITVAGFLLNGY